MQYVVLSLANSFSLVLLYSLFLNISQPLLCCSLLPLSPKLACFHSDFLGYLSHPPSILPYFHHEIRHLGVFTLFRLSYMHLMWKRLSREPLIYVELAVSVILILSWCFPRRI